MTDAYLYRWELAALFNYSRFVRYFVIQFIRERRPGDIHISTNTEK